MTHLPTKSGRESVRSGLVRALGIDPEIEALKRRASKLRSDRGTLNTHLEEIAEVIYPNGMGFIGTRTTGEKRMTRVYDETGITANRLNAASMHSMATNPATKWFGLRAVDNTLNDREEVKKWRSDCVDVMYAEMYAPGTNLIPALHEFYLGLGAFGTAVMFIGENEAGGLLFQTRALAECYHAENTDGFVDTMFRIYPWTVRQCYEEWGDKCSKKICDAYEKKRYDDTVEIVHHVGPRHHRDHKKKGPRDMAFASVYFEMETCNELEQSGFPEFPYVVARWEKAAGETYGRSPGMEALPAVKMLQAIEAETIKIMQKMANPPLFLGDDGITGAIRTIPGALNFWRGNPNDRIMQLPTSDKIPITLEWTEAIRNRVRTIFNNDTLQIVDERQMTLGEARMRKTERMRLQGPNIGRLDAEMLGPKIGRVHGILDRKGKIPPAPDAIDGKAMTVEFVSPLANAQKQEQLAGLTMIAEYLLPFGEAGAMALGRKMNMDRTIDGLWDILANDPDWLNTDDEMKANAEQEAKARNAAMAPEVAGAANQATGAVKNLADANAGGGIDMNKLMQSLPAMAAAGGQRAA